MSVHENAVVLRFADRSAAYRALSDLKHLTSDTLEVRAAVLIERLDDGTVRAPERIGPQAGNNKMLGSMAGSMAGMTIGPVGMLMGTGLGTALAGGYDIRRAAADAAQVEFLAERVPPNATVVCAEVKESDTEELNLLGMEYDAIIERCPAEYLRGEMKAMQETVERTRKEETKAERARKRAEATEKVEARFTTLRQKLAA